MRIIPQRYARHSAHSESDTPIDQSPRYFSLIRIRGQRRSLTILLYRLAMQPTSFFSIYILPHGKKSGMSAGKISTKKQKTIIRQSCMRRRLRMRIRPRTLLSPRSQFLLHSARATSGTLLAASLLQGNPNEISVIENIGHLFVARDKYAGFPSFIERVDISFVSPVKFYYHNCV